MMLYDDETCARAEFGNCGANILDDCGGETFERLVQQDNLRGHHQCAGNGHHLPLTTRQPLRLLVAQDVQLREEFINFLDAGPLRAVPVAGSQAR